MIISAEISCNHAGSVDKAIQLVAAAAACGADAVKFQTFTPEKMAIRPYIIEHGPWAGKDIQELYREAETPRDWHRPLFDIAEALGMVAFSTPFDVDSLNFLESINCPMYKIASFEIVDLELIRACASTGKHLYISTGMATWEEIEAAADAAKGTEFTFMKCTSSYPAPPGDANLRTMISLKRKFGSVGLSDHSKGLAVPITATVLGASIIEKHLTLSRTEGLDCDFSLEPDEFKQMVIECRNAEKSIGETKYAVTESEHSSFALRSSLYIIKDIKSGEVLTQDHVGTSRPNLGMNPIKLGDVLNKTMAKSVNAGEPLTEEMVR